jgi:hypothetical protein
MACPYFFVGDVGFLAGFLFFAVAAFGLVTFEGGCGVITAE